MKKFTVVNTFIIICISYFLLIYLEDSSLSTTTVIKYGAKTNFMIADYKLWYLISPIFIHASISHLAFNMFSMYIFASQVESYFGSKKFIIYSIIIAFLSTAGSFYSNNSISVGASGLIYGYFGFHIYLYFQNKELYSSYFGKDIFILIGINIIYSFIQPGIDIAGHLFGIVSGVSVFFLFGRKTSVPYQRVISVFIILVILSLGIIKQNNYKNSLDYFQVKYYYYSQTNQNDKLKEIEKEFNKYH